ncbi:MAG: hypothetical protein V5A45_07760 [Haloarculaceae archaeon]
MSRERGQLVVLAAAAIAIALVPMALAYLQLGYHADVQTATVEDDTVPAVERTLHQSLISASGDISARHGWHNRSDAVTTFRERLRPSIESLSTARLADGTAVEVAYNDSRAQVLADERCPRGPDRDFGPCRTDRAVVVQERDGRTHVLAIAVDVHVTTPDSTVQVSTVVTASSAGS